MSAGRRDRLAAIRNDAAFDVIVVGGGVNGIGVFRDLALQGLRVLLVERNDFSSGCSAAPSRMIHGGLRYLENGEFDLVRESLVERDALLANAPHMVRPLPTVIPITSLFSGLLNSAARFFGRSGKPSSRGALPIKLGLTLYDWVTRKRRVLPRHRFIGPSETRRTWPALTGRARLSAVYYDAWISHPERLCIEMIRDVERQAPASVALNYAQLSVEDGAHVLACRRAGERLRVSARAIVNATGAWLDATAEALGGEAPERMVSGTKGSHLILDNAELMDALGGHMVYFENADGRVCVVFPYLGRVLAGSTDIRVREATRVRCEEEELEYILASLRQVFPRIPVAKEDVVFSYSGIRPLPQSDHDFTGRISRGHSVRRLQGPTPQFCMIGGKWTTFRAFAEQTADAVLKELGLERRCATSGLAIGGGREFPADPETLTSRLEREFVVRSERAAHLISHYGAGAAAVQRFCAAEGDDAPLEAGADYTIGEIRHLIRNELVETLSDIALRRTSLAITGAVSTKSIEALAGVLASERSLSPTEIADQKDALIAELRDFHGVSPETLDARSNEGRTICASARRRA